MYTDDGNHYIKIKNTSDAENLEDSLNAFIKNCTDSGIHEGK